LAERNARSAAVDPALQYLREQLDRVNRDLLALLQRRGELVLEVAAVKDALGLDARDSAREAEMLRALTKALDGPYSRAEIEMIFTALFEASLELQRRARAAGVAGGRR
jgi:3-deoxy-7-phosphoheptulonate synthase/chorismate mutase